MSQSPLLWNLNMEYGLNPEALPFTPSYIQPPTLRADSPVLCPSMELPADFLTAPAFFTHSMPQLGGPQELDDGYFSGQLGAFQWSESDGSNVAPSIEEDFVVEDAELMILPCQIEERRRLSASAHVRVADRVSDYYDADVDGSNESNDAMSLPRSHIRKRSATKKRTLAVNAAIKKAEKKTTKQLSKHQEEEAELMLLSVADKHRKAVHVMDQQAQKPTFAERLGEHVRIERSEHRVRIEGVFWHAPQNDESIPGSEREKAVWVHKLVDAMTDTDQCKEKMDTRAFQNRWGEVADFYSEDEFLNAAWGLVDFGVDVHTNGWTTTISDSHIRASIQKTMFCSFEDRFHAIVKLLKGSKRTCEGIMKGEKVCNVVGNPWELETRTSSNASSNAVKGETLKKANERKRGRAEMEAGEGRALVAARPVKKAKTARK